jgi:hypothetical protein
MSNISNHNGGSSLDPYDNERAEMLVISRKALTMLCEQLRQVGVISVAMAYLPPQTMTPGDFIAELRDLDVGLPVVDEVIIYMAASSWVQLWRHKGSDETWISLAPTA